ncbi:hypothetical protein PoMZ_09772, partial [Pyricularia oryzae]
KDHLRLGRRGTECDGGVEVGGNGWSRLLGPAPRTPQLSQTRLSSLAALLRDFFYAHRESLAFSQLDVPLGDQSGMTHYVAYYSNLPELTGSTWDLLLEIMVCG